jgi:hypothetical protein
MVRIVAVVFIISSFHRFLQMYMSVWYNHRVSDHIRRIPMHIRMKFSSIFYKTRPEEGITRRFSKFSWKKTLLALLIAISIALPVSIISYLLPTKHLLSKTQLADAQALRSTRLDAELIEAKSRLVSSTLVESTFRARVRAYGGDIYLPAYSEDIVFGPKFMTPDMQSNAVIPGTATIRVEKELGSEGGRYILKQYEDADITVTLTSKIIPDAMTSPQLTFKTELSSFIWRPVKQEVNEDEVGNPFLDVSSFGWETNPVIVFNPEFASSQMSYAEPADFQSLLDLPAATSMLTASSDGTASESVHARSGSANLANIFGMFAELGRVLFR